MKLEFFGNNFKLWFDWFHVFSCVVETKIEASIFYDNFKIWFDWFHVSSCVVETKIEACIFLATIVSFHLIDCMFLVVVLLKQKLKLEVFGNNFKLWFDWFHVSSCVVEIKIEAWIFLQQFQALVWLISCF